ncbi:MAG: nucleotidyltransferase domain-containing protein [Dehalococcoidia bacterium]|nr:nucleotidyltransferase domain-containing protein [Dehalococcoidia bacterium]
MKHQSLRQARAIYALKLEQSLRVMVERLQAVDEVTRISVFGSYARGRRDLFTDLDTLVVMDTQMGLMERLKYLYSTLALPVDVDILCYTVEEFDSLKEVQPLKGILKEEQLLYEKKPL